MKTELISLEGIFIKNESQNESGSIKDRFAEFVFNKAIESGELSPGQQILEVTSGNTGIAFSRLAKTHGHKFIAVMPEFASKERVEIMKSNGAEVILTPAELSVAGAVKVYEELVAAHPEYWLPRQFKNENNIEAHYRVTGAEIVHQIHNLGIEKVDAFVAGVGTGGTILGVSKALKEAFGEVRIVAVEPAESAVMSGGPEGFHKIEGIGEGFIPPLIQERLDKIDEVVAIKSDDAIKEMRRLGSEQNFHIGISSGANLLAAKLMKEKYDFETVITVAPDGSDRYGSIV